MMVQNDDWDRYIFFMIFFLESQTKWKTIFSLVILGLDLGPHISMRYIQKILFYVEVHFNIAYMFFISL
jgi:dolichyl-phosphate-mannose--protein O-mannosyl transferase